MALQIMSFYPIDDATLAPTPNVTETQYINDILNNDDNTPVITNLDGVHLNVLVNHRGTLLYCAGQVTVIRSSPTTFGGNGYYTMPSPGTEETVEFSTVQGRFRGQVRYH